MSEIDEKLLTAILEKEGVSLAQWEGPSGTGHLCVVSQSPDEHSIQYAAFVFPDDAGDDYRHKIVVSSFPDNQIEFNGDFWKALDDAISRLKNL